jgi:mannose-6-phosphate isomerase-like protein (cupin superfamily)
MPSPALVRTVDTTQPEEDDMAKASSATADNVKDFGVAIDRASELEGYTVNFVSIKQSHDLAPMLAGLPTGKCTCPHWGYVLKGRVIVRYDDREEVLEAGDAFYMPPGHAPEAEEGTELIQFSPAAELAAVEAAIMAAMSNGSQP